MVREQSLKHRDCQNPAHCWVRVKPLASPCSSPDALTALGAAAGWVGPVATGWRLKYCGHWVLWALWAHGWLFLAGLSAGSWDLSASLMLLRGSGARLGAGLGSVCPAQPPYAR